MSKSVLSVLAFCLMAGAAQAETRPPGDAKAGAPEQRLVEISVSSSIALPLRPEDIAKQAELGQQAREQAYNIAAKECDVLLATIAQTCRIERLSVQMNPSNAGRYNNQEALQIGVTTNASYRVVLKTDRPEKSDKP